MGENEDLMIHENDGSKIYEIREYNEILWWHIGTSAIISNIRTESAFDVPRRR